LPSEAVQWDLLAKERKTMHERKRNPELIPPDEHILETWQRRWDSSEKGRWTYAFIANIST